MWAASLRTSVAASPTSATRKINATMFARIRCSKSSGLSSCKSKSFREQSLNSYCERSSSSQMLLVEACTRFSANAAASLGRNLTTFISKLSFAACRSAACCASQARAVLSDVSHAPHILTPGLEAVFGQPPAHRRRAGWISGIECRRFDPVTAYPQRGPADARQFPGHMGTTGPAPAHGRGADDGPRFESCPRALFLECEQYCSDSRVSLWLVGALSTGGWVHSINIQFSNPESRSAPMRCGFFNGCVYRKPCSS
jgi:hypothetical protein